MIYRVEFWNDKECQEGFEFHGNIKKAKKAKKDYEEDDEDCHGTIVSFKTPKTKKEILTILRVYASHPDNG